MEVRVYAASRPSQCQNGERQRPDQCSTSPSDPVATTPGSDRGGRPGPAQFQFASILPISKVFLGKRKKSGSRIVAIWTPIVAIWTRVAAIWTRVGPVLARIVPISIQIALTSTRIAPISIQIVTI